MNFQAKDLNFETKVISSFARQLVMETIGASITSVKPGQVEITLPFSEKLVQQHGFIDGGIVATVLDSACGYAAYSLMPEDASPLSIEYKINFMRPAAGEIFIARGRVIKPGKTVFVAAGEVVAVSQGEEREIAVMQASIMAVYQRSGIEG